MAKKILVIDDEPNIVDVLKARLEANGYEVVIAHDGDSGLDAVKLTRPDLIILDVMMPRMDGLTFAKKMKADESIPDIPIIVLTAKEKMRDLFEIEGIKDYITKPYTAPELLEKIRRRLQK